MSSSPEKHHQQQLEVIKSSLISELQNVLTPQFSSLQTELLQIANDLQNQKLELDQREKKLHEREQDLESKTRKLVLLLKNMNQQVVVMNSNSKNTNSSTVVASSDNSKDEFVKEHKVVVGVAKTQGQLMQQPVDDEDEDEDDEDW